MYFNYFTDYLKANYTIPNLDEALLKAHTEDFTVPAKTIILHPGEPCTSVFFIEEGLIRSYRNHHDQEETLNFYFPNQFATIYKSFFMQQPNNTGLIAESHIHGIRISYTNWHLLRQKDHAFDDLSIQILSTILIQKDEELNIYQKSNARTRYLHLHTTHPDISTIVLQKDLASFIGIGEHYYSSLKSSFIKTKHSKS